MRKLDFSEWTHYSMTKQPNQEVSNEYGQDESIQILRYFQILIIHKWIFLSVFATVFTIIMLYALRQPKIYKAQYNLFYNESIHEYMDDSGIPITKSDFDKNYWLGNMTSNELARQTIKYSNLSVTPQQMRDQIEVVMTDKKQEDRIPIYKVTVSSTQPQQISLIIKAYIRALNDLLIQHQINNSEKFIGFLTNQLTDNNNKLDSIEGKILGLESSSSCEIQDAQKIKSNLDMFRTNLINAQIALSSVKASKIKAEKELQNLDGTIVNESAFTEPLKVQMMNLEVDLARSLTKNKEDHPSIKAIRKNIQQLNQILADSVEKRMEIKSLMQNPLKTQLMSKLMELQINEVAEETQVASLQKVIAELQFKLLPDSADENQQQLLRNREMVLFGVKELNSKLIETQSAARGSLNRFTIIDEPTSPIKPANKGLIIFVLAALIGGVVLGVGSVFVYDMIDNRLMVIEDFEQFFDIPIWGSLAHFKHKLPFNPETSFLSNDNKKTWPGMNSLLINMRQPIKYDHKKLFAVCSSLRHEGKSLISLKLAEALADKKFNVLLVDMDFFSPKLTKKLGMIESAGLANYISDESSIDQVIRQCNYPGLSFTCVGSIQTRPDLYYDDPKLSNFIEKVRKRFDVVIFDTPAALYIPEIFNFLDMTDGIIIIARLRLTTRNALDKLLKLIRSHKTKISGVIINDIRHNILNPEGSNYYSYNEYYYNESEKEPPPQLLDDSYDKRRIGQFFKRKQEKQISDK